MMYTIIDEDGLEVARINGELLAELRMQYDGTPSWAEWKAPKRWAVLPEPSPTIQIPGWVPPEGHTGL